MVIGLNSFRFAASPVNALQEAHRVSRIGASVVIAVFGKREDTEAAAYLAALGSLLPPPPPGAPGPFALSFDGALGSLAPSCNRICQKWLCSSADQRCVQPTRSAHCLCAAGG